MARGKPSRSKEKKATQKQRTAVNQLARYRKNIEARPNHAHAKAWATKAEHYEKTAA